MGSFSVMHTTRKLLAYTQVLEARFQWLFQWLFNCIALHTARQVGS